MTAQDTSYTPVTQTQDDPGRTLGIVGLVLAIVANVIGLIVSIVAFRKSKQAGFDNGLAKAGIVVGCITTVLGVVLSILYAVALVHLQGQMPR